MKKNYSANDTLDPLQTHSSTLIIPIKKRTWHDPSVFVRSGINLEVLLNNSLHSDVPDPTDILNVPLIPDVRLIPDVPLIPESILSNENPSHKLWRRIARRIAKLVFRLLKPVLRPIAFRWRAYLSQQISTAVNAELQKHMDINVHHFSILQKNMLQEFAQMQQTLSADLQVQAKEHSRQLEILQKAIISKRNG